MSKLARFPLLLMLAVLALLVTSCSDDDDPVTPPGDTTAPLVSATHPEASETDVGASESLYVIFNEDMDPDSAAGAVTLSNGTVTGANWIDERTLHVTHTPFTGEGVKITATLGTGLKDAAGNALAEVYSWSFYTESTEVTLLDYEPEAGAVDVPRQPMIRLLFSDDMDLSTLYSGIMVTDAPVPMKKASFSFDIEHGSGDWIHLLFENPLPADAQIWVTITPAAEAWDGRNLSGVHIFSFRTSSDLDTTPPHLISAVPASGSTIDPDTPTIVFTFDEAIDPSSVYDSGMSAELVLLIELGRIAEPSWNEDYTQMTIVLPTPLRQGAPLEVVLDQYADVAGNVQEQDEVYTVTVGGTPDYYPVADGDAMGFVCLARGGEVGLPPAWNHQREVYYQFSVDGGGDFRRMEYSDGSLTPPYLEGWDKLRKTGGGIFFRGFYEIDEDGVDDVDFDDQVAYLNFPIGEGDTWGGSTDVTAVWTPTVGDPESFSAQLSYAGEVLPMIERMPVGPDSGPSKMAPRSLFRAPEPGEGDIYWMKVWPVEVSHTISVFGEPMDTGVDTLYYAPGRGLIQSRYYQEDYDGETPEWEHERCYWFPYVPMDGPLK